MSSLFMFFRLSKTMTYASYICAFGPHPDDVEVGCGGLLHKTAKEWKKNIIIDLTPSQMSTRGTPETRIQEWNRAASILWVQRKNLWLDDGLLKDDERHRLAIVREIRTYRPEIILVPYINDRHPDHEIVPLLIKNAIFFSWLQKYECDWLPPHRPRLLLQYMIRDFFQPDIIVSLDQSDIDAKMQAFTSYWSQTETNKHCFDYMKARAVTLWFQIKSDFWEWFATFGDKIWVNSLDDIVTWFW